MSGRGKEREGERERERERREREERERESVCMCVGDCDNHLCDGVKDGSPLMGSGKTHKDRAVQASRS